MRDGQRCNTCRFYDFDRYIDLHEDEGKCRRHAPIPYNANIVFEGAGRTADVKDRWRSCEWVIVSGKYDWCGEWKSEEGLND